MKKTWINFIIVLVLLFLSGCNSNHNSSTIKDGYYVIEQASTGFPYVHISDGEITLGDLASSFSQNGTSGTYVIDDDTLTMTTEDNKYIYVFQVDENSLIFLQNESTPDNSIRFRISDNAIFHLLDDLIKK